MIILVWVLKKWMHRIPPQEQQHSGFHILYYILLEHHSVAIAIMAVINIVHALKNPSEISEIVTMSTSDDDEIAAEAKDGAENLSDEEYARRLREEGGK